MQEAFALMETLKRGIDANTAFAEEMAKLAADLEADGRNGEATALRAMVRHHRAQGIKLTALLGALEFEYGLEPRTET